MSHEIRTPINSVLGMAQLALRAEINPVQRDYLNKIYYSGEHLLDIINDILDFSKIDAGKLSLEAVDFELGEVIESLINLAATKAEEKNLGLVFDIDPSIPQKLRGDPLRLKQVLINFINNAIKFTEKGEIILRAKAESVEEGNILLRFEVQDTGIGIDMETIPKLFRAFQQGDSSISRKYGGSGLGLVISKRLAHLMEGEIGVDSHAGAGSNFWFTARLGTSVKPELTHPAGEAKTVMATIRDARILLVEDNLFNQQVAAEFFAKCRCQRDGGWKRNRSAQFIASGTIRLRVDGLAYAEYGRN
ncbi:MAG: ATP-binding protein [Nitrosomonadales bacterium]